MPRNFAFTNAIVRTPGRSVVDGLRAGGGTGPTYAAVLGEHEAYVAALCTAGLLVEVLPPLEDYPDALFVEDVALTFPEGAILLRPGAPSRAGEVAAVRPTLERHFAVLLELTESSVDGGDVLVLPDRVLIGRSDRTNHAGAAALCDLLARLGRRGEIVETPPGVLHFKTGCSLIDAETLLTVPALADCGAFAGMRVITTPPGEDAAANILRIRDTLLINAGFPRTADLLGAADVSLVPLSTRAIAMIDAGLSCMSLRW